MNLKKKLSGILLALAVIVVLPISSKASEPNVTSLLNSDSISRQSITEEVGNSELLEKFSLPEYESTSERIYAPVNRIQWDYIEALPLVYNMRTGDYLIFIDIGFGKSAQYWEGRLNMHISTSTLEEFKRDLYYYGYDLVGWCIETRITTGTLTSAYRLNYTFNTSQGNHSGSHALTSNQKYYYGFETLEPSDSSSRYEYGTGAIVMITNGNTLSLASVVTFNSSYDYFDWRGSL
ncbi:MAG: hypothetical protein R3Y63_14270 [Eubacteriales bacterium]